MIKVPKEHRIVTPVHYSCRDSNGGMNSSTPSSASPARPSSSSTTAKGVAGVVASIFPAGSKTLSAAVQYDFVAKKIVKARSDRLTADKAAAAGSAYKSGGAARPGSLSLQQAMAIEVARDYRLTTAAAIAAQAEKEKGENTKALVKRR